MITRIDRYDITGVLGQGGHGTVYLGFDPKLDREVAIKLLNPELAEDADARARFHREARAVAKLHHANILEVFDYSGPESELGYLVMERLHGENLDRLIVGRGRPLAAAAVAAVGHELCLALAHAHAQGIVHRDMKPENVFVEPDARIVLCDFGIARGFDQRFHGTLAKRQETQTVGSPLFMSPEQVDDPASVGPASDLFSLGTVLYFLVSGRLAFEQASVVDVLEKVYLCQPHPLNEANIPQALVDIIGRAHQARPEDRYPSAKAFGAALFDFLRQSGEADPRQTLMAALSDLSEEASEQRTRIHGLAATQLKAARTSGATTITAAGATTISAAGVTTTAVTAPTAPTKKNPWGGRRWVGLGLGGAALLIGAMVVFRAAPQDERIEVTVENPAPNLPPPETALPAPAATPTPPLAAAPPPPSRPAAVPPPTPLLPRPIAVTPSALRPAPSKVDWSDGTLRISAKPWADVYVDDMKVGTTPLFKSMHLTAGKHALKLVNPSFPTIEQTIEVHPNNETSLSFHLKP